MSFLLPVLLVLVVWLALRRANELAAFELSRDGARLVRGRSPAELTRDVADIARRGAVPNTTIRVVSEGGEPRLVAPVHLGETVVQRLRNVVGRYRVVHFRTGRGV